MTRFKTFATLLLSLALNFATGSSAAFADSNWEVVTQGKARDQVTSYVRDVPGNAIKAFKGTVEMPYPALWIMATLADIKSYPEWVFQCNKAERDPHWPISQFYMSFNAPWPVSGRDAYMQASIRQNPQTYAMTIITTLATGHPETKNLVRIPQLNNSMLIEPLKDGWTRLTFETFVSPGGSIPAWVANWVATSAPKQTLKAINQQTKQSRYHLRAAGELTMNMPGMDTVVFPAWALPQNAASH